jgi:Flp pilus assembly secretin CpaC
MNTQKTLVVLAAVALPGCCTTTTTMAGEATAAAGLAICPVRTEMGIKAARPSITLELGAGSTVMLERPFKTALIGDPDVIDVQMQTGCSVLLKPLGPGATNLIFIDEQGIVITNLTIYVRSAREI